MQLTQTRWRGILLLCKGWTGRDRHTKHGSSSKPGMRPGCRRQGSRGGRAERSRSHPPWWLGWMTGLSEMEKNKQRLWDYLGHFLTHWHNHDALRQTDTSLVNWVYGVGIWKNACCWLEEWPVCLMRKHREEEPSRHCSLHAHVHGLFSFLEEDIPQRWRIFKVSLLRKTKF